MPFRITPKRSVGRDFNSRRFVNPRGPLAPTPGLKTPKTEIADIDFREFKIPGIDTVEMSVTESPATAGKTLYSVRLTAPIPDHPTWTFYLTYEGDKYKPQPNVIQTSKSNRVGTGIGMAVPAMRDPNKILEFYLYGFSKHLKDVATQE